MDVGWGFSSPLIFLSAFASAAAISPLHLRQQFLSFRFFSFLSFSLLFFSVLFFSSSTRLRLVCVPASAAGECN